MERWGSVQGKGNRMDVDRMGSVMCGGSSGRKVSLSASKCATAVVLNDIYVPRSRLH